MGQRSQFQQRVPGESHPVSQGLCRHNLPGGPASQSLQSLLDIRELEIERDIERKTRHTIEIEITPRENTVQITDNMIRISQANDLQIIIPINPT